MLNPEGFAYPDTAYGQVDDKLDLNFEDMCKQNVKNIARHFHSYSVIERMSAHASSNLPVPEVNLPLHQEIKFYAAPDGVQIAYSSVGNSPPLIKTANWLNHLEYDWKASFGATS